MRPAKRPLQCVFLTCLLQWMGLLFCSAQQERVQYRPKIGELRMETLFNYDTRLREGGYTSEVNHEQLIRIKLGIPLLIKDQRMAGLQLKYYRHRFNFDKEDPMSEPLYDYLDATNFYNIGARLFWQETWKNKTLRFLAGSEMRGDERVWNRYTTHGYASASYQWRANATTTYGFGVYFSQGAGITNVLPTASVIKELSTTWTLDMNLPKSVQFRKQLNAQNFLTLGTQALGWRYHISELPDYPDDLILRKLDIRFAVAWERELYDWLWASVEAGYHKNLRYYANEVGHQSSAARVELKAQDASVINFSIFMIPPKKFYQ